MSTNKLACFAAHEENNKSCQNKSCRFWHDLNDSSNCILNKVKKQEDFTLQEVGNLFGITRMRVCQIEKQSIAKIRKKATFAM
jgi:DNA-directed RNA polymerase specialized sigma subunit